MTYADNKCPADKCRAQIIFLDECESTNSYLKSMNEAVNGTVVVARTQTGGRGRMGRSFASPEGGLYMTRLIIFERPDKGIPRITALAAAVTAAALEKSFGIDTEIKWPNDILLNGKKLCGILTECVTRQDEMRVFLGIGINLNSRIPEELKDIACSLADITGTEADINGFASELNRELDTSFEKLPYIPEKYLDDYKSRCGTVGKVLKDGSFVKGIADDYSLILVSPDGSEKRKFFGEI